MSKKTIINLSVYVVLFSVLWLGVRPLFDRNNELKAAIADLELSIAQEQETQDKINALLEDVSSKEDELEFLDLAILPYRDVASAVVIIEEASAINGLSLSSISVSDLFLQPGSSRIEEAEERPPNVGVLLFGLELAGKYSSFLTFLGDIEETFPLMDIADIQFKPQVNDTSEEGEEDLQSLDPQFDFTISLEAYYRE